jgi:hypothetical protein
MDDADVDYLCRAVEFLAEAGHLFLPLYRFDLGTGAWCHADECDGETSGIGIREALAAREEAPAGGAADSRVEAYARYLAEAEAAAARLLSDPPAEEASIPGFPPDLVYFDVNRFSTDSIDETEE